MQQPPLLPEETLARVARMARFDGMSVLVLGSLFALMAAVAREVPFAAIGLLAAGAGAIELHGLALLHQGERRGMNWLVASQPLLLLVILSYCGLRIAYLELPVLPEHMRAIFVESAQHFRMTPEAYFVALNRTMAGIIAGLACVYQGGMTWYFLRRRDAVVRALETETDA